MNTMPCYTTRPAAAELFPRVAFTAYGAVMPAVGQPGKAGQFSGIAKMDLAAAGVGLHDDAVVAQIAYGPNRFGGEAVFVPRFGHATVLDAGCDDGYLLTYVYDEVSSPGGRREGAPYAELAGVVRRAGACVRRHPGRERERAALERGAASGALHSLLSPSQLALSLTRWRARVRW